jgi:hypothetical protein
VRRLIVLLTLVLASPAAAADRFGPETLLAEGVSPAVSVSPNGAATVAWSRPERGGVLVARRRPGARAFGKPVNVVPDAHAAGVLMAQRGNTLAVAWREYTTDEVDPADTTWVAVGPDFEPERIAGALPTGLAVGAGGAVMVAVDRYDDVGPHGFTAVRPPGGPLGAPVPLPEGGTASVVAAPDGGWRAVWIGASAVLAADAGTDGVFNAATPLSAPGEIGYFPALTTNTHGELLAAWWRESGGTERFIESASRPAAGPWQPAEVLGSTPPVDPPAIALDALTADLNDAGDAMVGFEAYDDVFFSRQARRFTTFRPAGGAFGEAAASLDSRTPSDPSFALDSEGATVIARRAVAIGEGFFASVREGDGRLGRERRVSEDASNPPTMGMDEFGNGVLAWTTAKVDVGQVHVAGYSRRPPQLSDVSLAGRRVRFTVDEPATVKVGKRTVVVGPGRHAVRVPPGTERATVVARDAGPRRSVRRVRSAGR